MAEKFTRWDVADHLKTEEDIIAYFEACLEAFSQVATAQDLHGFRLDGGSQYRFNRTAEEYPYA